LQLAGIHLLELERAREKLLDQLEAGRAEAAKLSRSLEKRQREHSQLLEEKQERDLQIKRLDLRMQ